ncbi:hypothetical protein ACFE04_029280 [Oxalis oulophora]
MKLKHLYRTTKPLTTLTKQWSLSSSSSRFSTTISLNEDHEAYLSSFIIDDNNLLRKSQINDPRLTKTTTGLRVLDLIDNGCLKPNVTLYRKLLMKCTDMGKLELGRTVHTHIMNSSFKSDIVVMNTIIDMYAKSDCLEDARKVFDEMSDRDLVSWTVLITGYSQHGKPNEALALFPGVLRQGLKPNQFTLSSVLKASADATGDYSCGTQLHALCLKSGYIKNVYVGSSLVDMYARSEIMNDAQLMFDGLESKNEVSWNALISGHARKGQVEDALRILRDMMRQNFQPTQYTFSGILNACASLGSLEQGKWVHAHMLKLNTKLIAFVGNTLLHMYAKSGSIDDAEKIFDRLAKRDVVSWNSMLTAYAQHGHGKGAVELFEKMRRVGVAPNHISYLSVLTACSRAGLLDEGLYYFDLMKCKVEPKISHYVTMVDLFGRAGLLDRAERFIKEMPIKPTAAVWGALLGACRMHKNTDLGVYAADRIFELDPHNSGPHVVLYNIYASAGRWAEAAKVRLMMKESGVKKEPACSWVEIENAVHTFVADDFAHPLIKEIHKMWEGLYRKIKEIGYVPDASNVLLHVNQEERETKLQYHSEKLALAFALLKTPPGSTIRIKKNIRVCSDCHSAIKFVSKVMDREIIVRDTNRFHHFSNGFCSCGDYW